jgi:hypothetical protein
LLPIKTIRYDWCLNKTYFCNLYVLWNVRASGKKGATARVLRSSRNGRHLINCRHCLQTLRAMFVYICAVGVFLYVFISMFVCLLIHFVCIPFLYLFIVYVMWLYFIIFSLKVYLALKRDYHILSAYWLIVYDVFLKISRNILCII